MVLKLDSLSSPFSSLLGFGEDFQKSLVFLIKLAWDSRFRLPVIITVGFMVLDVRMQLEINVDVEIRNVNNDSDVDTEEEEESSEDTDESTDNYN